MKKLVAILALSAILPVTAQATDMLNGMIIGYAIGSSDSPSTQNPMGPSPLSAIPFRCLAMFEESEEIYKTCRRPSLRKELSDNSRLYGDGRAMCQLSRGKFEADGNIAKEDCNVDLHLGYEIQALRKLQRLQAAKAK